MKKTNTMSTQPTKSMTESLTPLTDMQIDDAHNIALYDDCKGKDGFYRGNKIETEVVPSSFARSLELRLNAALAENEEFRKSFKEIVDLDLGNLTNGKHNFYTGASRFFKAWLIAHKAFGLDNLDSAIQSTNKPK